LEYTKSLNFENAALEFEKALALNPADIEIANNLGFAQSKLGKYDEAKRLFFYTLMLAPDRVNAWANLGYVLADQGEIAMASGAFYNAILFSPKKQAIVTSIQNAALRHNEALSRRFSLTGDVKVVEVP
jgi:Flp pilus assembly protein TadD